MEKEELKQPLKPLEIQPCAFDSDNSPAVSAALEGLIHLHLDHTEDKVTRFVERDEKTHEIKAAVYITGDAEWIERLRAATSDVFPQDVIQ